MIKAALFNVSIASLTSLFHIIAVETHRVATQSMPLYRMRLRLVNVTIIVPRLELQVGRVLSEGSPTHSAV